MPSNVDRFVRRLEAVEKHSMATAILPRLPYATLDGGSIDVSDPISGEVRVQLGQQWDGGFATNHMGGPPLPPPTVPLVTPKQGGLSIYWDGTFVDNSVTRTDFGRVTFHAVADVDDLDPVNPSQIVGEVNIATGSEVFAALPPAEWFIFAFAWSASGVFSAASEVAFGTPLSLVDDADFADIQQQVVEAQAAAADAPAVYREPEQPAVAAGKKAVWYDTNDGNVPWFFDGSTWTKLPVGQGALSADAVIAETIAVGALDGKRIIAPLIETNSAVARGIKLVNQSLVAYNGSGAATLAIDGATGGITMVGPLLTGGSVTGSTVQTTSENQRGIKVIGSALRAYDGAGVERVTINGTTGTLSVVGNGSNITGAMYRTAATGERLEISTDFMSRIRFFSGAAGETEPSNIEADDAYAGVGNRPTLVMTGGRRVGHAGWRPQVFLTTMENADGARVAITGETLVHETNRPTSTAGVSVGNYIIQSTSNNESLISMRAYKTPGSTWSDITMADTGNIFLSGTLRGSYATSGASGINVGNYLRLSTGVGIYYGATGEEQVVGRVVPWSEPVLQNGWVPASNVMVKRGFSYKKINGVVHLQGAVSNGTMFRTLTVLPVHHRPLYTLNFVASTSSGPGLFEIRGEATSQPGEVFLISGGTGYFSLDCSFIAEM